MMTLPTSPMTVDEKHVRISMDPTTAVLPTLVVEGDRDADFILHGMKYEPSFTGKEVDIVVLKSKKTYFKLLNEGQLSFQHCALLDRDHDDLLGVLISRPGLTYTEFYSIENYVVLDQVVRALVGRLATSNEATRFSGLQVLGELRQIALPLALVCYLRVSERWVDLPIGNSVSVWRYVDRRSLAPNFNYAKEQLSAYLDSRGVILSAEALDTKVEQAKQAVLTMSQLEFLKLVPGKHLFDVLYILIGKRAQSVMKGGKSLERLFLDLCGYLDQSPEALRLLVKIAADLFPSSGALGYSMAASGD